MTTPDDILKRLETLNAIGVALSSERDLGSLLERILEAARGFANADGGTLYRVENETLVFEVLRNDTLGLRMGGKTGKPIDFAPLPMHLPDGSANDTMVVVHAALTGETVNIPDAYTAQGFDFSGTRAFDSRTGYRSQSFLTVPMKDHSGAVIGVLQLINAKDADGTVCAFSRADQQLVESLASQAAIALNNRKLVEQLESLFEALISLINTAIDEKSPYTAGHCERVPVLTMLLAEAASRSTTGPLADFRMSETDRYELKIAGLLHDCGKITTPVHVVDKATKLETIFDRIALIDARFEVLLRDAEIAHLKGELSAQEHAQRVEEVARRPRARARFQHRRRIHGRCRGQGHRRSGTPHLAYPRRSGTHPVERRGNREPHDPSRHPDRRRARHQQPAHQRHHRHARSPALAWTPGSRT